MSLHRQLCEDGRCGGSGQVPFLLAEQRRGWSLMIFCARATSGLRRVEEQPGRPPARGTRTIRKCSFDARTRGSTRPSQKTRVRDSKRRAVRVSLDPPALLCTGLSWSRLSRTDLASNETTVAAHRLFLPIPLVDDSARYHQAQQKRRMSPCISLFVVMEWSSVLRGCHRHERRLCDSI